MKPSVTELIGLLDKPALLKWANKIGLEGIALDSYRKKVMNQGTSLHKQIEDFILHNKPFIDNEYFIKFQEFMNDKQIISVETNVENDYFRGRYDIKLKYNGLIYICDFKSNHKAVYFENKLQLVSYKMADNCDEIAIISIPDFKFMAVEISDFEPYEQIIINLFNIYSLKKQI